MNKKKKIVFVIPELPSWGGAEKIIHAIVNSIDYTQFEVTLVLFQNTGDLRLTLNQEVKLEILNVHRIRYYLLKFIPFLWRYKPDIVFTGWGELSAYMSVFIPLFPRIKFIARETNIVSEHVTRKSILFFYRFYNNFHRIVVQSDDMYEDLLNNFNIQSSKLYKINNPINLDAYNKALTSNNPYDKSFKNVVVVGNISYRKGIDNILRVFAHISRKDIVLNIVGDGLFLEEFKSLAQDLKLENVIFHGKKTNAIPFINYADLFVLSSRYEGFPNVLLEAGACGVYALCNNCKGGINEIILEGQNGDILPIENHSLFAQKIEELVDFNSDSKLIKQLTLSRYHSDLILPKFNQLFKMI